MNYYIKFSLTLVINIIVTTFLLMVGVILTSSFQENFLNGGVFSKVVISTIWTLGLLIVLFKGFSINWSIFKFEEEKA